MSDNSDYDCTFSDSSEDEYEHKHKGPSIKTEENDEISVLNATTEAKKTCCTFILAQIVKRKCSRVFIHVFVTWVLIEI